MEGLLDGRYSFVFFFGYVWLCVSRNKVWRELDLMKIDFCFVSKRGRRDVKEFGVYVKIIIITMD